VMRPLLDTGGICFGIAAILDLAQWLRVLAIVALIVGVPGAAMAGPSKEECVMWQWCVYEGAEGDAHSRQCQAMYPKEMSDEIAQETKEPPRPHGMIYEAFCTQQATKTLWTNCVNRPGDRAPKWAFHEANKYDPSCPKCATAIDDPVWYMHATCNRARHKVRWTFP
jgi:hypothetical protein